eukprot:COSAG01_NODE_4983_length_4570_cov_5.034444_4_plen_38_part_01
MSGRVQHRLRICGWLLTRPQAGARWLPGGRGVRRSHTR